MKVTVKEYAKIVGKCESAVRHAILDGKIPAEKTYWRIYVDSETPWFTTKGHMGAYKHGLTEHPLRNVWSGMKQRCYNTKNPSYRAYGARGITVCDEWKNDFVAFVNWCESHGYKKGLSLDRIDNTKGYSPDNCRFITVSENSKKKKYDNEKINAIKEIEHKNRLANELRGEKWYVFKRITINKKCRKKPSKDMEAAIPFFKKGFTLSLIQYGYFEYEMGRGKYKFPKYAYEIETPDDEYIRQYIDVLYNKLY